MLSVLIVCRRVDALLMRTVKSVEELKPQILIDISEGNEALGIRKNRLITRAAHDWVLVLDTDETISQPLAKKIHEIVKHSRSEIHGYKIQYRNYSFGRATSYGGEKFAKTRLFQKRYGLITPLTIHEEIHIDGKINKLNGFIQHYSYRSFIQLLIKFTKYAWQVAGEKRKAHERVTLKKLFLYGPHMVWARVIKDEGWRDGWRGIVIALCFGYMETLTYWLLLWRELFS